MFRALFAPIIRSVTTVYAAPGSSYTSDNHLPTLQGLKEFSAPAQKIPGAHPAFYTMGIGLLPLVKWPGNDIDHPLPSSAEAEGRVEFLPLLALCACMAGYRANFTFHTLNLM